MASATLTPYYNNTQQQTFALVSTDKNGSVYRVAGRDLATPRQLEIIRKIGPTGAAGNDHITLKLTHVGKNSTTAKISAGSVTVDISCPRDTAAVSKGDMQAILSIISSLLNESTAMEATSVAITALTEGRDL